MPHPKKTRAAVGAADRGNDQIVGDTENNTGGETASQPEGYSFPYNAVTSRRHGRSRVVVNVGGKYLGHASQFGPHWRVYTADGRETVDNNAAANLKLRDAVQHASGAS